MSKTIDYLRCVVNHKAILGLYAGVLFGIGALYGVHKIEKDYSIEYRVALWSTVYVGIPSLLTLTATGFGKNTYRICRRAKKRISEKGTLSDKEIEKYSETYSSTAGLKTAAKGHPELEERIREHNKDVSYGFGPVYK